MFQPLEKPSFLVRIVGVSLLISLTALFFTTQAWAQTASPTEKPTQKTTPQGTFSSKQSIIWKNLLEILKSYELAVETSDESTGTLKTKTKRYFKIASARFPPIQRDYRDTYTIKVASAGSETNVNIERKFEVYDSQVRDWVEGDPKKEKAGVSVESFLEDLRNRLGEVASP